MRVRNEAVALLPHHGAFTACTPHDSANHTCLPVLGARSGHCQCSDLPPDRESGIAVNGAASESLLGCLAGAMVLEAPRSRDGHGCRW